MEKKNESLRGNDYGLGRKSKWVPSPPHND